MSRLEKLCAPAIDYVRRKDNAFEAQLKSDATLHAIGLGALSLYGDPNVDEPLSNAWQRCSERFSDLQLNQLRRYRAQTFAEEVARIVRQAVMFDLPGSSEHEKFRICSLLVRRGSFGLRLPTSLRGCSVSHCRIFRVSEILLDP
jgi:hypothetical protein